jgi:PAS domain-containing protein
MGEDLAVATFPREDAAFAAYVTRCRADLAPGDRADPAALERLIRHWHTRAVVRPRDGLAGFGSAVWYVYRDGSAGIRTDDEWWGADGVARVVFGADGRVLDADPAACAIAGLPPDGLAGVHWTSLVPPEAATGSADWLGQQLRAKGYVQSVFDCPLPEGGRRVIEYRSMPAAEPGRFECRWRVIATIEAVPEAG